MNNAGKCAGPPGWLSAPGRLYPRGRLTPGRLPSPGAGTLLPSSRHTPPPGPAPSGRHPPARTLAPPGLAPTRVPASLLRGRRLLGRVTGARTSPSGPPSSPPAPAGAPGLPAGHRAPRGCAGPIAGPAGTGLAASPGQAGGCGDNRTGGAGVCARRGTRLCARSALGYPPQSPWEICCDFVSESLLFGEVVLFCRIFSPRQTQPLSPSVNFPGFFLGGNWAGERDGMRREQILKKRRSTVNH